MRGYEIGFVSIFWVGGWWAWGKLGSFRIIGGEKASGVVNWVRVDFFVFHRSDAAEIGFVSRFLAVGVWRLAVGLGELGSFGIFWLLGW